MNSMQKVKRFACIAIILINLNMTDLSHPVTLSGRIIELIPLERTHFDDLLALSKDIRIWQHYAMEGHDTFKMTQSLETALLEREKGTQYAFVIIQKEDNKIIGSTRLLDIQKEHQKLEIGWTWMHPDYWAKNINTECKFLLLEYCFENLGCTRVQLRTDENNIRSRKAIEKTGAQFEGIIRNDMIRNNGTKRNSAYYSIIDSDWLRVKQRLLFLLALPEKGYL